MTDNLIISSKKIKISSVFLLVISVLYFLFFVSLSFPVLASGLFLLCISSFILIAYLSLSSNNERVKYLLNSYLIYLIIFFYLQTVFTVPDHFDLKLKLVTVVKLMLFYLPSAILVTTALTGKRVQSSIGLSHICYMLFLVALFFHNPLSMITKSAYAFNSFFVFAVVFFLLNYVKNIRVSIKPILFSFLASSFLGLLLLSEGLVSWNMAFFELFHQNSVFAAVNGLPRTWYTAFLDFELFRRFNGLFADPILYGFFSAILLVVIAQSEHKWLKLFIPILLCFLFFSFSKGAIYLFFMTYILYYSRIKFFYKNFSLWILLIMLLVGLNALISLGKGSSADIHFSGLILPFLHFNEYSLFDLAFGHGFTSGGNLAKSLGIVTNENWLHTGAESGIGTIFYQTGIVGLMFILYFFYTSMRQCSHVYTKQFISVYFVLLFTQENLLNMNYLVLFMFAIYSIESRLILKDSCVR